jgi:hypothetical protein
MRIRLDELRKIIRTIILEGEDERVYDDTVLPGEEADDELLAEPDLTDQEDRDDYINDREKRRSKKKRDRLNSREETEEGMADESSTVGGGGMSGHIGTSWGPRREERPLHSRNAMGGGKRKKRSLDEYDE